jgi:TetR/AcrR family acrAB operon transcriptional repressor
MARRTKEEALATRERLIDTAEDLFYKNGVSHTPLNAIALAAGVTRGAIYWHFKDKADLFNAMMQRVDLPMEDRLEPSADAEIAEPATDHQASTMSDPLRQLRLGVMSALRNLVSDDRTRRVYEIATHKVEYVGELESLRAKHIELRAACMMEIEASMRLAIAHSDLRLRMPVPMAARGLHAVVNGLIHDWMLSPAEFDLMEVGREVVGAYLAGLSDALVFGNHLRAE